MIMRWYVLTIFLITGLSVVGFLIVLFNLDPHKDIVLSKYLFFTSFFMFFWGFSTLVLNRFKFKIDWPDFYKSFKTAFIISLVVCLGVFVIRYAR